MMPANYVGGVAAAAVGYNIFELAMMDKQMQSKNEMPVSTKVENEIAPEDVDPSVIDGAVEKLQELQDDISEDINTLTYLLKRERWRAIVAGAVVAAFVTFNVTKNAVYKMLVVQTCKNKRYFALLQMIQMYKSSLGSIF